MTSIVTSLYKSDQYLDAFTGHLKRVANFLTSKNFAFEIIVIANDPTDREKQLAKELASQSWFKFVTVGREPLYATWNRGVSLAKGEAIGFWNADDVRFSEAILEASILFQSGAQLVYFPFKVARYFKFFGKYFKVFTKTINSQIPEFNTESRKEFQRSMFCGPFFMFTKALYEQVGPFDEQFKIAGDFDWCVRAAKVSASFKKAKNVAGEFRVDGDGLSAGGNQRQLAENNIIYKRYGISDKIGLVDQSIEENYNIQEILKGKELISINKYV